MTADTETPRELLTAKKAAELVGIARPNLDKWLGYRGITPAAHAPHPTGNLYDQEELIAARDAWLLERDRESDEKRRAAALANVTESAA